MVRGALGIPGRVLESVEHVRARHRGALRSRFRNTADRCGVRFAHPIERALLRSLLPGRWVCHLVFRRVLDDVVQVTRLVELLAPARAEVDLAGRPLQLLRLRHVRHIHAEWRLLHGRPVRGFTAAKICVQVATELESIG